MNQPVSKPSEAATPGIKRGGLRKSIPRIGNLLLWMLFCAMSGTGLLLAYRLPPGSRGGRGLSALGWTRHDWGDLHQWISFAFLVLIVIHMCLHWRWFWQIAGKRRAWPLLVGIFAGLVLLVGIALMPVKRESNTRNDASQDERAVHPDKERARGGGRQFRGGRE